MIPPLIRKAGVSWLIAIALVALFLATSCGVPENQSLDIQEAMTTNVPNNATTSNGDTLQSLGGSTNPPSDPGGQPSGTLESSNTGAFVQSNDSPEAFEPPPPAHHFTEVAATGTVSEVNGDLKPALESALGVDLTLVAAREDSRDFVGGNLLEVRYLVNGNQPVGDGGVAKISEVVAGLRGRISSATLSGPEPIVNFEGLQVGGVTGDGRIRYHHGVDLIAVTLRFSEAGLVPSGMATLLNDDLEPFLETALGADLLAVRVEESIYVPAAIGSRYTAVLEYHVDGDLGPGDNLLATFPGAFESRGGKVTVLSVGRAALAFEVEGIELGGVTGNARVGYAYRRFPVPSSVIVNYNVETSGQ